MDPATVKIVIADDSQAIRSLVNMTLRDAGFEHILICNDGDCIIDKLTRLGSVDIIISDWDMPKRDGLNVLQAVRHHPKHKDVPFIMLTANHTIDKVREVVAAGVTDYIAKPFQPGVLLQKVYRALEGRANCA